MLLHGVTKVIIVDDALVSEEDLLTNFFVDAVSNPPQPRAEVVAALLAELNPFATVTPIVAPPSSLPGLADLDASAFVITVGNQTLDFLNGISAQIYPRGIRHAHFQTTGLFGAFYIDGILHTAIEGPSDIREPKDFRIHNPFPALAAFVDSIDLTALNDADHSHIPFVVLLIKLRKELFAELGVEKLTSQHKPALLAKLSSWRRSRPDPETGEPKEITEAGFDDATDNLLMAYGFPPSFSDTTECLAVVDSIPASNTDPFWQLARATKAFVAKHGTIPHYGGCPDMNATPALFKQLKDLYREKSSADLAELLADPAIVTPIDPQFAARFIRNVWRIAAFRFERIGVYLERPKPPNPEQLGDWNVGEYSAYARLGVARAMFIAARRFLGAHGRNPALADKEELLQMVVDIGPEWKEAPGLAEEFLRVDGHVLPSVVAALAAVLARQVSRLLIHQGGTVNGLAIYDAAHRCSTLGSKLRLFSSSFCPQSACKSLGSSGEVIATSRAPVGKGREGRRSVTFEHPAFMPCPCI
jgi:amyloid beta precursor protein binding protein 1